MDARADAKAGGQRLADGLDVTPDLLPYLPELLADLPVLGSWPEKIVELLRDDAALPRGARVLDLCCGKGPVAVPLARELGLRVLGIDLFPPFVAEARARAAEAGVAELCRFEVADVRERLGELRGYDAAVLAGVGCGVLGGYAGAVEKMRRAVRPGGYLVIDDGFFANVASLDRPGYEYYRTQDEVLRELTRHGDKLVREVVLPDEALAAENRRNNEHIRRRASELIRRRPESAATIEGYVERELEECHVLETLTKGAVWLLRRPGAGDKAAKEWARLAMAMQPSRPENVPDHAERCLAALTANGLGHKISLGGAFGLLHYLDYRKTHDVDAWWSSSATQTDRDRVIQVLEDALVSAGKVRVRTWGDVVSIELMRGAKKVFSFQIARRTAQLQPSSPAPWTDVLLDSFVDLLASKMVALVERGAPRDFRDVYTVCRHGLATPSECWRLWRERQRSAESDTGARRARLAVETHLARIVQHRPLEKITDPEERARAEQARLWYETELLDALVD